MHQEFTHFPALGLEQLDYPKVLQVVASLCFGEESKEAVMAIKPITKPVEVNKRLEQVLEMKNLLMFDEALPLSHLPPVTRLFNKAYILDNYLTENEFFTLLLWLRTVKNVKNYFVARADKYPSIAKLLDWSHFNTDFIHSIEKIISPEGYMMTNASPALQRIRSEMQDVSTQLRTVLNRLLRDAKSKGWTDSKELTLRNERLVIPIDANFKGKFKGLVHDVSGTGQTVFIEPLEALPLNNELRELAIREKNEIIRILTELTDKLRPNLTEYKVFTKFLITIDVIRAKAQFAVQIGGNKPHIDAQHQDVHFVNARHPLLILQKTISQVVPLNVKLNHEERVLVISGPNAGGKSVSLRTVGLLQLMTQAGFLIPADETTRLRLFDTIFVDIGDNQSMQSDLSTYTSHLSLMLELVNNTDGDALFLIDEFGTGTEPKMGGAIAEALLELFVKRKSYGIITTHYGNLKEYAERCPNTTNGAMRFDLTELAPTYELSQGLPGSSYALEIAARVGIPKFIIESAKKKVGEKRVEFEHTLASLKQQQEQLQAQQAEYEAKLKDLNHRLAQYAATQKEVESQKKRMLSQAKEGIAQLYDRANQEIEETIRKIRQEEADKQKTLALRKQLNQVLQQLPVEQAIENGTEDTAEDTWEFDTVDNVPIQVNDWVQHIETNTIGKVIELVGKKAVVAVEDLRTIFKSAELVKIQPRTESKKKTINPHVDPDKSSKVSRQLDIRGMRVEQALPVVQQFMDDIVLAGVPQALILHGKGTGALRTTIRQYLRKQYKQVQQLQDAPENQGGSGITICGMAYA
jgi:DNA mismatch repair protein MutS2